MKKKIEWIFSIVFLISLFPVYGYSYSYSGTKKNVLILNSYHQGFKWTDDEIKGIESGLFPVNDNIKIYIEYMGTKWNYSSDYFRQLGILYKKKFGDVRFDVIISTDDDAFNFLKIYRDEVFGEVPVVFCGLNWLIPSRLKGITRATGINEAVDIELDIYLMLKLHSKVKKIYVIIDSTTTGDAVYTKLAEITPRLSGKAEIIPLYNLDMEHMCRMLSSLGSDSLVLLSLFSRDSSGRFFEFNEYTSMITGSSTVPVYGLWDFNLGYGIVGGKMASGYSQGFTAGNLALRILQGEQAESIPVVMESPNKFMFDYTQLQRFRIERRMLPAESELINLPSSFYSVNKRIFQAILAVTMALSVFTIVLIINIRKRSLAEITLSEKVEQYSTLVNNLNVGVFRSSGDPDGCYIQANTAMMKILGYDSVEDLLSTPVKTLYRDPSDRSGFIEGLKDSGTVSNKELLMRRRDGTPIIVTVTATASFNDDGGISWIDGILEDITDRKKVAEELKLSELRYRSVIAVSNTGAWEYNNRSGYLWCSPEYFQMLGYDPADCIMDGTTNIDEAWLNLLHPEDRNSASEHFNNYLNNGSIGMYESFFRMKHASGNWIWIWSRGQTLRNPDGTLSDLTVGAHINITERKMAEEAIRDSEAKFRTIVESSPVGYHIYRLEDDGRLVFTMSNQAADRILHVNHEPFIGFEICEAFPALAGTGIPEMYTAVARGDLGMQNFEAPYDHNGIRGVYEVRVFCSTPGQAVVNFFDISERKLAEERQAKLTEQLHQSQKMDAIGQLAGGVAHDFNNLLSGIMGAAQMLQIAENLSEKQEKYISMILSAAERAGNLTKKLLTFSRSGNKASTAVDCLKIINDTVEILQHTIDKNITITVENRAVQTSIVGDDTLLMNAFMNMGINSSHAMPSGGTLSFILENCDFDKNSCDASTFDIRPGKYLDIAVRDTGWGMPPEVVSRIFEPFFSTREKGKGTGLGLSMVYGTVKEHGGAVTVYSEPEEGTVFHIYLPVDETSAGSVTTQEFLPEGTGTVLLIDDEELIRITAKGLLESLGYKVIVGVNGEEGAKIFSERKSEIDLIILDMIMPVLGGREAFIKLREIDPDVPILIASGFAKEEHMSVLKVQGFSGFLQKPFRISELAEKVYKALGGKDNSLNF